MTGGHQFVRVGTHAFVGATSKMGMDVPPYILCGRDPLSFMGINKVGLQRRGFSNEKIAEIHEIYRYIYLRNMNRSQAMEAILKDFPPSEERDRILTFIRESKRGIIKGPGKGEGA
jgi:UDP-N-acetylglucosamine acyltransferase